MRGHCPTMRYTNCSRLGHSDLFCKKVNSGIRGTPAQLPVVRQSGTRQAGSGQADSGTVRPAQPNRSQAGSNIAVPREPSRVFAIDEQVADRDGSAVVRGTILCQSSFARVLFDTGSSISVIVCSFANNLGLEPVDSETFLQFETVTGTHTIPKHVCYKCPFLINDTFFEWDLIALEMLGFDLILGMDWLSANHAVIKCDLHRVTLSPEVTMSVRFIGDRAILNPITGNVRNSLSSLFALLSIEEVVPEHSKIESLPVVCEFPEVFPDDLWELLP